MGLVEPFLYTQSSVFTVLKRIIYFLQFQEVNCCEILCSEGEKTKHIEIFIHLPIYINLKGNCFIWFWNIKIAMKSPDTEKKNLCLATILLVQVE